MICQRTLSSKYPLNDIPQPLVGRLFPEGRALHIFALSRTLKSACSIFKKFTKFFDGSFLLRIPQSLYSPDLRQAGFLLILHIKEQWRDLPSRDQASFFKEFVTF
jgi:hypothetical protein